MFVLPFVVVFGWVSFPVECVTLSAGAHLLAVFRSGETHAGENQLGQKEHNGCQKTKRPAGAGRLLPLGQGKN